MANIHNPTQGKIALTMPEFRRLALQKTLDLFKAMADQEDQRATNFVKRTPAPLERYWTTPELKAEAHAALAALTPKYPPLRAFVAAAEPILDKLATANSAFLLLDAYDQLLALENTVLPESARLAADMFHITADARRIYLAVDDGYLAQRSALAEAVERDVTNVRFMASVGALLEDLRERGRAPTNDESVAIALAYELLGQGVAVSSAYQSLGISGFRDIQTYLSLADPGEGHIKVTSRDLSLLRGVVVHIEHIDRDEEFDTELVEPYRLPAAIHAARVRLHVGSHAPCTAFIGRPVFESQHVRRDLLKSVHMTASACTAMFRNGVADCKISIERMTTTEAIDFMRAVVGNVLRDRNRQFLSAAYRINFPIVDDRPETVARHGQPVTVSNRMELAKLGVELAKAGGFDKVAWDGSSNEVPSIPILEQLSLAQFVELAHLAHAAGLECYVSAGCVASHMRLATLAAIDGVGIGTSMHYIDPETKLMGALKPEAILEALEVRDAAAREPFAQCTRLLARLDRMYANGGLGEVEDEYRWYLFEALRDGQEQKALQIAGGMARMEALKPDFDYKLWSWVGGWEVLERAKHLMGDSGHLTQPSDPEALDEWQALISRLEYIVREHNAPLTTTTTVG
jgi:hypothetical protein